VTPKFQIISAIMATGNVADTFKALLREFPDELSDHFTKAVAKILKKEVCVLCAKDPSTNFQYRKEATGTHFSYIPQEEEPQQKAPLLHEMVMTIGINPRTKRCKIKTNEKCLPAIMTAVSTLLFTRNHLMLCHIMNASAFINYCVMHRGYVKKQTYTRFNKIGLYMSYNSFLNKLSGLGEYYDNEVKVWIQETVRETKLFQEAVTEQLLSPLAIPISNMHSIPSPSSMTATSTLSQTPTMTPESTITSNKVPSQLPSTKCSDLPVMFDDLSIHRENLSTLPLYSK